MKDRSERRMGCPHPFVEKVHGKHIDRYQDLSFMFGNDIAHGSFASTAYSSPLLGRRQSRNEFNFDSETDEYGTDIVRLSSDSGEAHNCSSAPHVSDASNQLNRVNAANLDSSRGSKNTHSTATSLSLPKRGKPSDVIGDRMGEVADAVKSLTITMSQGKKMTRVQKILSILEEVDGLSPEDQLRATGMMQGDVVTAGFFMKMGHERRKEWVQKLLECSVPI